MEGTLLMHWNDRPVSLWKICHDPAGTVFRRTVVFCLNGGLLLLKLVFGTSKTSSVPCIAKRYFGEPCSNRAAAPDDIIMDGKASSAIRQTVPANSKTSPRLCCIALLEYLSEIYTPFRYYSNFSFSVTLTNDKSGEKIFRDEVAVVTGGSPGIDKCRAECFA